MHPSSSIPSMRTSARIRAITLALAAPLLMLSGCMSSQATGNLTVASRAENPVKLRLNLKYGAFAKQPSQHSFYMSSVPLDELLGGEVSDAIILHAQLLWQPKPGSTPVDPTATNVTLRLLLVTEGEVGLYGGAGFAWPSGDLDEGPAALDIVGSSMTLLDSTEGFRDLLSPVLMLGRAKAPLNSVETLRFRQAASQLVTDKLGRTRWVRLDSLTSPVAQAALQGHQETRSTRDPDRHRQEPDQS